MKNAQKSVRLLAILVAASLLGLSSVKIPRGMIASTYNHAVAPNNQASEVILDEEAQAGLEYENKHTQNGNEKEFKRDLVVGEEQLQLQMQQQVEKPTEEPQPLPKLEEKTVEDQLAAVQESVLVVEQATPDENSQVRSVPTSEGTNSKTINISTNTSTNTTINHTSTNTSSIPRSEPEPWKATRQQPSFYNN